MIGNVIASEAKQSPRGDYTICPKLYAKLPDGSVLMNSD